MTTVHTTLGVFKTHRRYEMRGIGTRRQFFLLLLTTAAALLWSASFAEGNAGAECETVACTNDPLCSNTQDPCSGKRCYFEGWGLNGLVKAKCHEESKQGCNVITSYGTHYTPYRYAEGDATTTAFGGIGPPCSFPFTHDSITYTDSCTTANEPLSEANSQDQGHIALPWCYTNEAQTTWAYCFPEGSPSCDYDSGHLRQNKASLSECSLNCQQGYEGYAFATCVQKNTNVVMPDDTNPQNSGCVPLYCSAYTPTTGVVGSSFSDSCGAATQLQAGTSCTVVCDDGYSQTGTGVISCPTAAENGEAPTVEITCSPFECAALNFVSINNIAGDTMSGNGVTNGCADGVVLKTGGSVENTRCNIRCDNDMSATPFTWEVYCPSTATNGSPVAIAGSVSCSTALCPVFVYSDSEGLIPASIGGCSEEVVTLANGQSCDLECAAGWKPQNGTGNEAQTIQCGDPYANGTLGIEGDPSCVPNSCQPFYFEEGMEAASGSGCSNGTILQTHGETQWCFVVCKDGYSVSLSDSYGGRVICESTSDEGDAPSYTYACTENSCAPFSFAPGVVGQANASAGLSSCVDQSSLSTQANPTCAVACGDGYRTTGEAELAVYSCPVDAEAGEPVQLSPATFACVENTCKRITMPEGTVGFDLDPSTTSCADGLIMFSHTSPSACALRCDAGYSATSPQSTEILSCPYDAVIGFEVEPLNITCEVAITQITMTCGANVSGCDNTSAVTPGGSSAADVEMGLGGCSAIATSALGSLVMSATEGGDVVTFSNFDTSTVLPDTFWKLVVGDSSGETCQFDQALSTLTCFVPPSSGREKRVYLMKYTEASSEDTGILNECVLNYASPAITSVTGCASEGCERVGGDYVTIHGSNFGSSEALVFVNGVACTNITHGNGQVQCTNSTSDSNCHRMLSCILPGLESWQSRVNHVLVVQSNLFGSTEVQYKKCGQGQIQEADTPQCAICPAGKFNDILDAFECLPCAAGTYSSDPEASTCAPCAKNFYSSRDGSSECAECSGGTFSEEGSDECDACDVWYLGETSGHCETPVFAIVLAIAIVLLLATVACIVTQKYAYLVGLMEEQEEDRNQLAKDISLLQNAWILKWEQIEIEKKIAAGGGGVVFLGKLQGLQVAVKTIFDTKDVDVAEQAEVKWMQRARHPRLVLFFGMGKRPPPSGNVFVVIEFMGEGDLLSKFEKAKASHDALTWVVKLRLLQDVAEGMFYIHTVLGSIHRDLKSENVLLKIESGSLRGKVADFGLSRIVPKASKKKAKRVGTRLALFTSNTGGGGGKRDSARSSVGSRHSEGNSAHVTLQGETTASSSMKFDDAAMTSARGTVAYMAPELLSKEALRSDDKISYSQSVDTYAFGLILWEALCLSRAWGQFNFSTQVIDRVVEGVRPEIPKSYAPPLLRPPAGYTALMNICWHQEAAHRPKFDRIVEGLKTLRPNSVDCQGRRSTPKARKPKNSLTLSDVHEVNDSSSKVHDCEIEMLDML